MINFNYSQVPAVVTITATEDVVIPVAGEYLQPTQYITLAKGDVLKVVAGTSTEMTCLTKACEDLGIIPEITPIEPADPEDPEEPVEPEPEEPENNDQEIADQVATLIDAIGNIAYTTESETKIIAAETAYAALTDAQKAKVTNYSTLTSARSTYESLHAEVVAFKNAVSALPATAAATDECRIAVVNCATTYSTLTSPGQVDAVKTEKAKYDAFRAEWEASTASEVVMLIDQIGLVKYNNESVTKVVVTEGADDNGYHDLKVTEENLTGDFSLSMDVMYTEADSTEGIIGFVRSANESMSVAFGYSIPDQKFYVGTGIPFGSASAYPKTIFRSWEYQLHPGAWYNLQFRMEGTLLSIYANNAHITTYEFEKNGVTSANCEFLILYPQYITLYIGDLELSSNGKTVDQKMLTTEGPAALNPQYVLDNISLSTPVDIDAKIDAAENAYNSLSNGAKELVTNHQILVDARASYNALIA